MRLAAASAVASAAIALAGCAQGGTRNSDSTKDFSGEQKAVAATIEDLQAAAKDRKGATICGDLITAQLRDRISASGCPKVLNDAIRDTDEVDLIVKSVTLNGKGATAVVQEKVGDKRRRTQTITLEKAAGRWRVSALPGALS